MYEALFFNVDRVCVAQVKLDARSYKEAVSKARKLPEMSRQDVFSFDVANIED